MSDQPSYVDCDPARRAAVADAERLIAQALGTNFDPIIQALDARQFGPTERSARRCSPTCAATSRHRSACPPAPPPPGSCWRPSAARSSAVAPLP